MNTKLKCYSELIKLKTFNERFEYLKLDGDIFETTFGSERYLNQVFYKSKEWKKVRDYVITRDYGCDLGLEGYEIIGSKILVHHMNPITPNDILYRSEILLDPEYLITTFKKTHDAIHYGNKDLINNTYIPRSKNDTCPWKIKGGKNEI